MGNGTGKESTQVWFMVAIKTPAHGARAPLPRVTLRYTAAGAEGQGQRVSHADSMRQDQAGIQSWVGTDAGGQPAVRLEVQRRRRCSAAAPHHIVLSLVDLLQLALGQVLRQPWREEGGSWGAGGQHNAAARHPSWLHGTQEQQRVGQAQGRRLGRGRAARQPGRSGGAPPATSPTLLSPPPPPPAPARCR